MSKGGDIVNIHNIQTALISELYQPLRRVNQKRIADLHSQLQAAYNQYYEQHGLHGIPGRRPEYYNSEKS